MRKIWLLFFIIIPFIDYAQTSLDIGKLDDAVGVIVCYDHNGNTIGHGSCFVIDADGILITNYHVLEDVYSAKIKLESGTYSMKKIISGDKDVDLIKFSIDKSFTNQKFPVVKIAKNLPNKGDEAWAIGTPYDIALMNTVSKGLVANILKDSTRTIIQTNAEITNGSSGGALFNSKGEVIGVTSMGIKSAGANLNFAIWIGEISKLKNLNVDRIYNDALIPVEVSFYIRYLSYSNDVSLYIDSRYIGTFSSYFSSPKVPVCGQEGTITTYLSKGSHKFNAYEKSTGSSWSEDFTINTNECFLQGLSNAPPQKQQTYTPKPSQQTNTQQSSQQTFNPRPIIGNKYKYNWMFSTSLSPYYINTFATDDYNYAYKKYPIAFYFERYFSDHKISLQANYRYLRTIQYYNETDLTHFGLKYSSYGIELKKIHKNERTYWNWYIAGAFNFQTFVKDYSHPIFINNGVYETSYIDSQSTNIDLALLFKFGADIRVSKRFCFSWDAGLNLLNYSNLQRLMELNFILGYRFNFKK